MIYKYLESPSSRRAWIEIFRPIRRLWNPGVALLAEGVDRNKSVSFQLFREQVALLAEGVDRNPRVIAGSAAGKRSPSSRRAWIEISFRWSMLAKKCRSPSSRRAWIEIRHSWSSSSGASVALLAEGVDRNTLLLTFDVERDTSRPPRGGRG